MTPEAHASGSEWHKARRASILKAHPEIQQLYGRWPMTIPIAFAVLAVHTAVGFWCAVEPWWVAVIAAYTVGATTEATMFATCHEYCHDLAVRAPRLKKLLLVLETLPTSMRWSVYFGTPHLSHHRDLGSEELDPQRPQLKGINPYVDPDRAFLGSIFTKGPQQGNVGGQGAISRTVKLQLWMFGFMLRTLILGSFFTVANVVHCLVRRQKLPEPVLMDALSIAPKIPFFIAVAWWGGWQSFVYFFLAPFFFRGFLFNPFGLLWLMFHNGWSLTGHREHATGSCYNPLLNLLSFNLGYHVEHHDFPQIPWVRLRRVTRIAPEFYEDIPRTDSLWRPWLRYLTDSNADFRYVPGPESTGVAQPRG
jgi:sphingolipid delta-4 desaturase